MIFGVVFFSIIALAEGDSLHEALNFVLFIMVGQCAVFYPIVALITLSLLNKWMDYVHAAEKVFLVLGWDNIRDVDLPKRSQETKTGNEEYGYGTFFFRY